MSGIRLLTNSVFAGATTGAGTLAVSSGAATASALNDRDAGPQWVAADGAAQTITVDTNTLGGNLGAALALIHHNLTGAAVTVQSGPDGIAWTPRGVFAVNADPFFVAVPGAVAARYWRLAIPALATPARIGEVMLGVALAILDNPNLPTGKPAYVADVAHDRSPAGYPWNTRKGQARRRYEYRWNALPDADLATLQHAFAEAGEGAYPVMLTDQLGVALWVTWENDALGPPGALGVHLQEMAATFEEIPQ